MFGRIPSRVDEAIICVLHARLCPQENAQVAGQQFLQPEWGVVSADILSEVDGMFDHRIAVTKRSCLLLHLLQRRTPVY